MARKTKTTETPAPVKTDKPTAYTLTEKGAALKVRAGTARDGAWSLLVKHAGQEDGIAKARAEINAAPNLGSINATNLFGWARKQGLIT